MNITRLLIVSVSILIYGCDPGQPAGTVEFQPSGYATALTQSEFNSLEPEEQYQVASKLYGTMLRGISAEDFFDISNGTDQLTVKPMAASFLSDTRNALKTKVGLEGIRVIDAIIDGLDDEGNPTLEPKYVFDDNDDVGENQRPRQLPLARIKEYPISQEFFDHWAAYFLSNTIMFSPAEEMETTDLGDVQSMYRFLVGQLDADKSVREIIRSNLPSLARWRVSRSPENHALEAYELYLGLFETEQDSFRGGIACKEFYLTTDAEGYLLRSTDFANTVPQLILDNYYITNCNDLYDVIAGHPLLMPRVTEVLINYFMSGRSLEDRLSMIESITQSGAETFGDIILSIIFSREYLLNTQRPRSFEENFMPLLDNLKWHPESQRRPVGNEIFINIASDTGSQINLDGMGWSNMSYKIGRLPDVPLDGLSFSNYHKAMREELLMNPRSYQGGIFNVNGEDVALNGLIYTDEGNLRENIALLSLDNYVDLLFLNMMQRKATATEQADLLEVYRDSGHLTISPTGGDMIRTDRYDEVTAITFDYISRLPETYYFRSID